ncbi:MAG: OmpA/MotB family protein [Planctomycetota bacterium]|jgi:flagellar motor protein MotB
MTPRLLAIPLVAIIGVLVAVGGCGPDPKERIALLEEENQRLIDQVNQARGDGQQARADADRAGGDRELCEQELVAVRADNDDLRNQLAQTPSGPAMPEGWTSIPGGAMIAIEGEVLFNSGKAVLRAEARRTLDGVARVVNSEYADRDVMVYGHTDETPIKKSGWKDNFELSAQRALAVVRYLQGRGVVPTRLIAGGCGEHRPRTPGASAAARSRNRRVEVYVLDPALQTASR